MDVESKYLGAQAYLISLEGDLDFQTADAFHGELEHLVSQGARAVIADLTSVPFIDSTGLSALLQADNRLRPKGGELVLVVSDPMTLNLLEVTGLDRRFPIRETVTEAIGHGSRETTTTP